MSDRELANSIKTNTVNDICGEVSAGVMGGNISYQRIEDIVASSIEDMLKELKLRDFYSGPVDLSLVQLARKLRKEVPDSAW